MIRYISHKDIDKAKWDECISRSFNGIIYVYAWYLDVVCKEWDALVEDDYLSVMPLPVNKKYGFSYIYQPFFVQQLGVFSVKKLTEETLHNFLRHIPSRFKFVELHLNTFNKLSSSEFYIKSRITHELDLIDLYENIYKSFSENCKRNIKKAEKAGLRVCLDTQAEDIIRIFRENRGKTVSNLTDSNYIQLERLIRLCRSKNKAQLWGIRTKANELCGGAIFIESNGKVIYFVSAANHEAKSTGAMAFLIDRFINLNAQRNLTLDFEGSNDINLARFYKNFGSKECVYLQIVKNDLPWYVKWLKK